MKKLNCILLALGLAAWPCLADLTVTLQPGYVFGPGETPTTDHLNLLGTPTIGVTGTLDGSASLAAGSVNGILLADSVPDSKSIGYTATVPRSLQVLATGILGPGLTNVSLNSVGVAVDQTLQINTSIDPGTGYTNTTTGVNSSWLFNALWSPWSVGYWNTNAAYYGAGNAWGFTNAVAITNLYFGTNARPAFTGADTVPLMAGAQGDNPIGLPLSAIERFVQTQNMQWVATLSFTNYNPVAPGILTNKFYLNSLTLTDSSGTYAVINPANPLHFNDTTNSTPLLMVITNIANAINTTPAATGTPQFAATVAAGVIKIYEPLLFYPRSTCVLTPGYTPGLVTNSGTYNNLTLGSAPTFPPRAFSGGNVHIAGSAPVSKNITIWVNTNAVTTLTLVSGTITAGLGASCNAFAANSQTNQLALLATAPTGTTAPVPPQIVALPPGAGIYVNNGNNTGSFAIDFSSVPLSQ